MFKNRLIALALTILLLSSSTFSLAETSTDYYKNGSGSSQQSVTLDGSNSDNSISVKYPATEVIGASLTLTASEDDGNFPEKLSVGVRNYNWKYEGDGYGALGKQERFSTDSKGASAKFGGSGETEVSLFLPSNATVTDASVKISGLPYGSGELDQYNKASIDTNEGSVSSGSAVSMLDDDYYVIWKDDGDLTDRATYTDAVIFRGYIDSSWQDPVLLKSNAGESSELYSNPLVKAIDDGAFAVWIKSQGSLVFEACYTEDEGQTWSDPYELTPASSHYRIFDYDVFLENDGAIHAIWSSVKESTDSYYDIYYQKSTDFGQTWEDEIQISGASNENSYSPQISSTGNNVYVGWQQWSDDNSRYEVAFAKSTDSGDTFGTPETLSGTNTVDSLTISSASSNLVVGWIESNDNGEDIIKARSSSNSGSSFSSENIVSSADGTLATFLTSSNNGGNDYFISWMKSGNSQPREIMNVHSPNSGASWNIPVNVDGLDNDDENQFRASPYVDSNSDRVIVVWSETDPKSGSSEDQDIVFSISNNDGSTWSDFNDISEHYYEADSAISALAASGEYLYLVYVDNGDYDQENDPNGNDASARDGDIFFTRSDDEGETWDDLAVLSNFEKDGQTDLEYSSTTLQYRPDVSATGTNVHAVWSDYDGDEGIYHIYYSKSENNGLTWSTPVAIDDGSVGGRYGVTLASDGSNVVAAWVDTWNYDIYTVYSDSNGDSWSLPMLMDSLSTSLNYMPEMIFNEGKFHLVWTHTGSGESVQYTSSDDGVEWEDTIYINTGGTSSTSYSPVISAEDSKLYVAWNDNGDYDGDSTVDYDLVGVISDNNGEDWNEDKLMIDTSTSTTLMLPSIGSGSGFTYLCYQNLIGGSYDYYFAFTQDDGGSWSDSYRLTDHDDNALLGKYHRMDLLVSEKTYFAFTEETDISGGDNTDTNVYVRNTLSEDYPEDPYIKVTGSKNWEWSGELNRENSPQLWGDSGGTKSLKNSLNEILEEKLADGDTMVDEHGVEMTEIIFTVGSDSKGTVGFSELQVEYDVELSISSQNLIDALNNQIEYTDGDVAEVNLVINSESAGKITFSDLEITTTDADLSLNNIAISGDLIEGNTVVITAEVTNNGEGDARVDLEFRKGSSVIKSKSVSGVTGGSTKSVSANWEDIPAGSHEITVEIVGSSPSDKNQGSEDIVSTEITVSASSPDMEYSIEFGSTLIENVEADWSLTLSNEGEKYGEVVTKLYWNEEDEDNLIDETPQTKIEIDESKTFTGMLTPTSSDDNLFIVIDDKSKGVLVSESIEIEIKKLPNLVVNRIVWVDNKDPNADSNEVLSLSDGSVAYAMIYVDNQGSFDLQATAELKLTKSGKDLQVNYAGVVDSYGAIDLPANQETAITFNGYYPSVSFLSGDNAGFNGFWNMEVKISNIIASKTSEQDLWNSELSFTDNTQTVHVATPPFLRIDSLTSSSLDIKDGQAVTLTISLSNAGQATASGVVNLMASGTTIASADFVILGATDNSDAFTEIYIEYGIPANYPNGELTMKVRIDRDSVVPALDPTDKADDDVKEITLNVEGQVQTNPGGSGSSNDEGSSGNIMIPLAVVSVVLVAGSGIFYFMRRTGDGEEALDPFSNSPPPIPEQPPAMAPPIPEQPPAMAPPVPEPTLLTIAVPAGAQPGQQIQIKTPDGRIVSVVIPAGLQEGAQFQVKI